MAGTTTNARLTRRREYVALALQVVELRAKYAVLNASLDVVATAKELEAYCEEGADERLVKGEEVRNRAM